MDVNKNQLGNYYYILIVFVPANHLHFWRFPIKIVMYEKKV